MRGATRRPTTPPPAGARARPPRRAWRARRRNAGAKSQRRQLRPGGLIEFGCQASIPEPVRTFCRCWLCIGGSTNDARVLWGQAMTQPTFVVVLHEPDSETFARLRTHYDFHQITPTVAVVRGEKLLSSTVAVTAGTSKSSTPPSRGSCSSSTGRIQGFHGMLCGSGLTAGTRRTGDGRPGIVGTGRTSGSASGARRNTGRRAGCRQGNEHQCAIFGQQGRRPQEQRRWTQGAHGVEELGAGGG